MDIPRTENKENTIDAPKLPDEIHYYLWNKIATLELKPGVKLSELKLAEQFNCSRIPVREAVRRLNVEGALESQPQRGSFVSPIDLCEVKRVRFLREVLETRIVLDAFDANLLTPLVPLLRGMVRDQKSMLSFNELEKLTDADTQFHDFFYHLENREFVQAHTGRYDIHYIRARRLALGIERSDSQRYDDSLNIVLQHDRMIDAIEKGDRNALQDELILHFRNINHTLEDILNRNEFREYFSTDKI